MFYSYPGPKNEQCHAQTFKLDFYLRCFKLNFDAVKSKFGLKNDLKNEEDLKNLASPPSASLGLISLAEECHTFISGVSS